MAGNCPGWSVYIVTLAMRIFIYTSFIFFGVGDVGELSASVALFSSSGIDSSTLVDMTPCRCRFMWPFCVSSDSGKCFRTAADVRPGHVV